MITRLTVDVIYNSFSSQQSNVNYRVLYSHAKNCSIWNTTD